MTLVNSLCAEISIFDGVGESTGIIVERSAIRGKKGLCKSMRDLAIKSRVLGDGYYYIPIDLWPKSKERTASKPTRGLTAESVQPLIGGGTFGAGLQGHF